ncbi:cyclin-D-binding Myb-like transcription factor 1 [Abrus precatorius]|uniref:Cyclin-D-binding Myb-like transcription factor 1 n=1 Tax=Abrus precatorius TaxID=3816 RepID=A0A8B8MFH8_ABRPR|nr:cyclin-D-binding Myb-like transcription factor 1 [Abrus precatorius]
MEEKTKKKRSKIDLSDLGSSFDLDSSKRKKKEPKEREKKHATDKILKSNESLEEDCTVEAADKQTCSVEGNVTLMCNEEEKSPENKSKKKKERKGVEVTNSNIADNQEVQVLDVNQESKMKKRKKIDYSLNGMQELIFSKPSKRSKMTEDNELEGNEGEDDDQGKKKKKKKKKKKLCEQSKRKEHGEFNSNEGDSPLTRVESRDDNAGFIDTDVDDQSKEMKIKKKVEADTAESTNPGSSKRKRVTFSDKVDVCCDGLVRGKRFTPKEDEKIKLAVYDYIESHGLGDEGLDMILHCQSHPEVKDCWKEIGAALPQRPMYSVYYRAHILFERDEKRKWTPEELEFLRKVQEQHGSDWKSVAEALGKHRFHVKDAWRRIKLTNTNKGRWTQEEYQKLFDLVNLDLRARASDGYRKSKHGMLRDNIGWEAIGDKLATRSSARCCKKWYEQLTSPMVASGAWSDTDDYRLISALFTLDPCTMAEVDWDNLLEHRPGDVCRKRWNQMVQFIGQHGGKPFGEQVEILAKRFCPDLLEVREAFDEKPLRC